MIARLASQKFSEQLGAPVIVENRAGAAGMIGTGQVAKAAPDGTTLLMGSLGPNAVNPSLYKSLPYHPIADFTPISLVAVGPYMVAVNSEVPVKSLQELVEYSKHKPDVLNYGSGGIGSPTHLAAELFKLVTGAQMTHVPYKGSAGVTTGLQGGEIQVAFITVLEFMPMAQSERVRGLAVASTTRNPLLPELPSAPEAGVPNYSFATWWGVMGPAAMPRGVVADLNAALRQSLSSRELQKRLTAAGATATGSSPEEFSTFLKAEVEKWANVVRKANIAQQ